MACSEKYNRLISLRAVNALEAGEALALERHALECAECAGDLRQAVAAMETVRGAGVPMPNAAEWTRMERRFWKKVEEEQAAVSRKRPSIRHLRRLVVGALGAAAVIAAALVLWGVLGGTPGEAPREKTPGEQAQSLQAGPAPAAGQAGDAGATRRKTPEERRKILREAADKGYLHACLAALNIQKDGMAHVVADSLSPASTGEEGEN